MADKLVLKSRSVYLNGYDVSGEANAVNLEYGIEEEDASNFAVAFKDYEPGLHFCKGTADLFLPADHVFEGALTTGYQLSTNVLSFMVEGGAAGNVAVSLKGLSVSNKRGGTIGQLLRSTLAITCKGTPMLRGKLLEAVASRSASANTVGLQFVGGVSAAQSLYIAYHVIAMTATSLDAVLQRDDNSGFTSAVTAITMSNFTAIGAEVKSVAGAITDDYYRLAFTLNGAGAYTVAAVIAVQ